MMEMNWVDWVIPAVVAVEMFFILILIGKYVDMRVKLSVEPERVKLAKSMCSVYIVLEASVRNGCKGGAFAIMPDGKVLYSPCTLPVMGLLLDCTALYWKQVERRWKNGMSVEAIQRRLPEGNMWRVKVGDIILYVEEIHDWELRAVGGFVQVPAGMVLIESYALRKAKEIESNTKETEVGNG